MDFLGTGTDVETLAQSDVIVPLSDSEDGSKVDHLFIAKGDEMQIVEVSREDMVALQNMDGVYMLPLESLSFRGEDNFEKNTVLQTATLVSENALQHGGGNYTSIPFDITKPETATLEDLSLITTALENVHSTLEGQIEQGKNIGLESPDIQDTLSEIDSALKDVTVLQAIPSYRFSLSNLLPESDLAPEQKASVAGILSKMPDDSMNLETLAHDKLVDRFGEQTAPGAHDIYVLVQTGDNSFVHDKIEVSPEGGQILKQWAMMSEEALDPAKVITALKDSGADVSDLNPNAIYLSHSSVMEAARIGYNTAMSTALETYDAVSKANGDKHDPIVHQPIEDLVAENGRIATEWTDVDMMISPLQTLADRFPVSNDEDYKDNVAGLQTARESLDYYGGLAQSSYNIYAQHVGPNGPETPFAPMNWDDLKYDNPADAFKVNVSPQ